MEALVGDVLEEDVEGDSRPWRITSKLPLQNQRSELQTTGNAATASGDATRVTIFYRPVFDRHF